MEFALQIIIGVFCLPLSILGIRSMFMPRSMSEAQSITPNGAAGLNTVRSVIGGFFFACVAMLALGLASGNTTWFLAVAILMGMVAVGRVVGLVADGFDKAVVPPLVIELVIGGLVVAGHVLVAGA